MQDSSQEVASILSNLKSTLNETLNGEKVSENVSKCINLVELLEVELAKNKNGKQDNTSINMDIVETKMNDFDEILDEIENDLKSQSTTNKNSKNTSNTHNKFDSLAHRIKEIIEAPFVSNSFHPTNKRLQFRYWTQFCQANDGYDDLSNESGNKLNQCTQLNVNLTEMIMPDYVLIYLKMN